MRFLKVLLACWALALFIGCGSVEPKTQVLLPDVTPFDTNPGARMAYIDAYRDGFRTAARGGNISTDYVYGPYRLAREMGWRAGVLDAQSAHATPE